MPTNSDYLPGPGRPDQTGAPGLPAMCPPTGDAPPSTRAGEGPVPAHDAAPRTTAASASPPPDAFLTSLLAELRAARFTPHAWAQFLARSWRQSLADLAAYPQLVAGTLRSSLWLAVVALVWVVPLFIHGPWPRGVTAAALVLAGLLVQQGFVLLHLGMVQPPGGGPRCAGLGIANGLTLLRALASWLLLAYGLTGVQSRTLLLGAFVMGAVTDAVDGLIARRVEVPTRMGRMLDAMADTLLFSIGALVLADRGFVPGWFAVAVLARYAIPLAWALVSYFLQLRPVRYAPTIWGKSAGVALATAFAAALLDPGLEARHAHAARAGLWLICVLLCAAMAVQLWLEYRRWAPAGDA